MQKAVIDRMYDPSVPKKQAFVYFKDEAAVRAGDPNWPVVKLVLRTKWRNGRTGSCVRSGGSR